MPTAPRLPVSSPQKDTPRSPRGQTTAPGMRKQWEITAPYLEVCLVLNELLGASVQEANVGVTLLHRLPAQFHDQPQDPVGSRVLGPKVYGQTGDLLVSQRVLVCSGEGRGELGKEERPPPEALLPPGALGLSQQHGHAERTLDRRPSQAQRLVRQQERGVPTASSHLGPTQDPWDRSRGLPLPSRRLSPHWLLFLECREPDGFLMQRGPRHSHPRDPGTHGTLRRARQP